MKRTAIKIKRATPRRTTSPRCSRQRCAKPAKALDLCKTHLVLEADRLESLRRRTMANGRCHALYQGPCAGVAQWAHVHSRRYQAIRWDPLNAVVLCQGHHAYFTHRPAEWEQWCRDWGIPWDDLRRRALTEAPMDPADVIVNLRGGQPT